MVFAAQAMSPAAQLRFPTGITIAGYTLPIGVELAVVVAFALAFLLLAIWGFSRTE